jgi:hypothetical protein
MRSRTHPQPRDEGHGAWGSEHGDKAKDQVGLRRENWKGRERRDTRPAVLTSANGCVLKVKEELMNQ